MVISSPHGKYIASFKLNFAYPCLVVVVVCDSQHRQWYSLLINLVQQILNEQKPISSSSLIWAWPSTAPEFCFIFAKLQLQLGWVWALFPAFLSHPASQPTGKVLPSFAECWPLAEFKIAYNKVQNWCSQQIITNVNKC